MRTPAFSSGQIGAALSLASVVQGGFVALLIVTQGAKGFVPRPEPPPREISIAVDRGALTPEAAAELRSTLAEPLATPA